jgi:hypothetical protein
MSYPMTANDARETLSYVAYNVSFVCSRTVAISTIATLTELSSRLARYNAEVIERALLYVDPEVAGAIAREILQPDRELIEIARGKIARLNDVFEIATVWASPAPLVRA